MRSPNLATLAALIIGFGALGYRIFLRVALDLTALYGDDVEFHAMDSRLMQGRLFDGPALNLQYNLVNQRSHVLTPLTATLSQAGITDLALAGFVVQMLAVAVGLLAAWAVTRRLLGHGAAAGVVAILGFAPLPLSLTYWFNPAGMLWPAVAVCMWLLVRAVGSSSVWAAAAVGASAGLAFLTKVHGALLLPGVLLVLVLAGRLGFEGRRRWGRCLAAGVAFAAVAVTPDVVTVMVLEHRDSAGLAKVDDALFENYELILHGRRPTFVGSVIRLFPPGSGKYERITRKLHQNPCMGNTPLERFRGLVQLRLLSLWASITYVNTSAFGLLLVSALAGLLLCWRHGATRLLALLLLAPLPVYLFTWSLHRHLSLLFPPLALLAAAAGAALAARAARHMPPRLVPILLLAGTVTVGAFQSHTALGHLITPHENEAARQAAVYLAGLDSDIEVVSFGPLVAAYVGCTWTPISEARLKKVCRSGRGFLNRPAYVLLIGSRYSHEGFSTKPLLQLCLAQGGVRQVMVRTTSHAYFYLLGPE